MTNYVTANPGVGGPTFAVDLDTSSGNWPYAKLAFGATGTQTPVSLATALPITVTDGNGNVIVASTSALQTAGNASLTAIATSVATLASEDAGLATATAQSTGNTTLASILAAVQTPPPPMIVTGGTVTRPANTTAYAFGQLLANSTTAGSVTPSTIAAARGTNVASTILRCRLLKSGTSITNSIFRLHLYNVSPTVTNGDGGTWLSNQAANYLGSMDVTIDKVMSDGSVGNGVPSAGSTIAFSPASGTANIFCLIEVRAAYTPISGEVFTPILEVQ
jgi:hypothetical protein